LNKHLAKYVWSAPYATNIWLGIDSDGNPSTPRRWTDVAIAEMNFIPAFWEGVQSGKTLDYGFEYLAKSLYAEFRNAISDEIYYWPNVTRRSNGETVFSPRDIRDTDTFYNSQSMRIS
jgi:hypothetical protein